jgi:hypothetical protein
MLKQYLSKQIGLLTLRRSQIIIFILALASSVFWHGLNRHELLRDSPSALRQGVSVITQDDASYLAPAENFIAGKGWKSNAVGVAAYLTRSPGYGLFYMLFRAFLSEKAALFMVVLFQILLFSYAVSLIPRLCIELGLLEGTAIFVGLFAAVMPMFSGFLSYTLTEGLTVSLVLIFFYFVLRRNHAKRSLLFASMILGILLLIRPAMIVLLFAFVPFFHRISRLNYLKYIIIAVVPLCIWQIHISFLAGSLQTLHPIYQADSPSLYRPVHKEIWDFHKSWGHSGSEFHSFIASRDQGSESINELKKELQKSMPSEVLETVGINRLASAYWEYEAILDKIDPYKDAGLALDGEFEQEQLLKEKFRQFRKEYIKQHFFYSNFIVPANVYRELAAHSNLNLYVFQKSLRGVLVIEVLRAFSAFIHVIVFLVFPIVFLLMFGNVNARIISIPLLVYIAYLVFIQRGVEERYTAPVLIPMFLLVAVWLSGFIRKLRIR